MKRTLTTMTAILRIVEDGDLKYEVALRGVKRIGGVTFYELDLADVPEIYEAPPLIDLPALVARRANLDRHRANRRRPDPEPGDQPHEDTP